VVFWQVHQVWDTWATMTLMVAKASSEGFGEWLTGERARRSMTVPRLAEASGVTAAQIYNIEAGRTANPQARTREKLGRALGDVAVPDEVVAATEEQSSISGLGSLIDFDPHEDADRPREPGVYVFYDISERPLYVGESGNIRDRVTTHEEKFWFRSPIVETAAYVRISDKDLRKQVEQILIRFLKSNAVINKHYVRR